jgi:hypothetical protein
MMGLKRLRRDHDGGVDGVHDGDAMVSGDAEMGQDMDHEHFIASKVRYIHSCINMLQFTDECHGITMRTESTLTLPWLLRLALLSLVKTNMTTSLRTT